VKIPLIHPNVKTFRGNCSVSGSEMQFMIE
jgi:hypothetical protein